MKKTVENDTLYLLIKVQCATSSEEVCTDLPDQRASDTHAARRTALAYERLHGLLCEARVVTGCVRQEDLQD